MREEWLAAVLDCDGSMGIALLLHEKAQHLQLSPYLRVANGCLALCEEAKEVMESWGAKVSLSSSTLDETRRTAYYLSVNGGRSVKIVLEKVKDYLIVKPDRAALILEFISRRGVKGSHQGRYRVQDFRDWLEMRRLNHAGTRPMTISRKQADWIGRYLRNHNDPDAGTFCSFLDSFVGGKEI